MLGPESATTLRTLTHTYFWSNGLGKYIFAKHTHTRLLLKGIFAQAYLYNKMAFLGDLQSFVL